MIVPSENDYFGNAFNFMLPHEGGFVNDKFDAGGATKWGISLRFLKLEGIDLNQDGRIDITDIKDMTRAQMQSIYYMKFWLQPKIYLINSPILKIKTFDFAVNMGARKAIKLLQDAVNVMLYPYKIIQCDGILGIKTCSAIDSVLESALLTHYIDNAIEFYDQIIANNPTQERFRNGWHNRAKNIPTDLRQPK